MKQDYAHIHVILDCSGSMQDIRDDWEAMDRGVLEIGSRVPQGWVSCTLGADGRCALSET